METEAVHKNVNVALIMHWNSNNNSWKTHRSYTKYSR